MVSGDGDKSQEVIIVPIVALIGIGLVIYWSVSEHHSKRVATRRARP
jgi:hypothetical protein